MYRGLFRLLLGYVCCRNWPGAGRVNCTYSSVRNATITSYDERITVAKAAAHASLPGWFVALPACLGDQTPGWLGHYAL